MKNTLIAALSAMIIVSCGSSNQTSTDTAKTPKIDYMNVDPVVYGNTITSEELKDMLYTYASDEFEGRETGEPGQKRAVEYLKQQYKDMGIASPLGGDDYFQEVPLEKQMSPKSKLSINGVAMTEFQDYFLLRADQSETINTSNIVFAGYGIDTDTYSDYQGLDVNNKVVLVKSGEPKNADGTFMVSGTAEGSKWSNGRQSLSAKSEAAKDHGAKALIFVDETLFSTYATYMANMAAKGQTGRLTLKSSQPEMIFMMANEATAKKLMPDVMERQEPGMISSKLMLEIESQSEQLSSENVVAFIKGSEKPDEILVISAHLDHEGIKDGEVYNGADDDGSGTIAILEIAEAFKMAVKDGLTPRRSILFLHVTGEEKGLLGSRHYTDNDPIFPLKNTIADLNIDMIGRTDPARKGDRNYVYLIGSDKLSTELHDISEAVNTKYANVVLDYTYNDENDPNRFYYRSDHYNFAKNNIPVIFYFNGTHADYHKPSDTPDKIEYDLLENRTRLVFYTAWELANRDDRIIVDKAVAE